MGFLFGPIVFFLSRSTDGSSLMFFRDRCFISCMPEAVFTTGKYASCMRNPVGTGTKTNQSFQRLEMDVGSRAE